MINLKELANKNRKFLQNTSENYYFSPGRVNLIGEHIDYHGGNVFPTAINLGTYGIVTKRDDKNFRFYSVNFPDFNPKIVSLDNLSYQEERNWANYASGIIDAFVALGHKIDHGLNILVYGNLPNGAGLSSSASLEVLIGVILRSEFNLQIDMLDIVKISQQVENRYIGVNCGIMDQFAIGMSKIDKAIYLDTNTLDYELVPLKLGKFTLVIANTNKKRSLSDSKYNERRSEGEQGIKILKDHGLSFDNLCELTIKDFEENKKYFSSQVIQNRIEHVIYENHRTISAVEALKNSDFIAFGKLMNQSHESLDVLYEVSCKELNTLVNAFIKYGAIGSRMTGAGFGGCTISLVETSIVDSVIEKVGQEYYEKIGYHADFYPVNTSDGSKKMESGDIE
ncbi:MAG: galactokinase [Bacilli bacterium]|nr:galactokinase [Bacilli bacterium]